MNVLVIHGPNLNLLGKREPDIYGTVTLEEINTRLASLARELGPDITFFQSSAPRMLSSLGSPGTPLPSRFL